MTYAAASCPERRCASAAGGGTARVGAAGWTTRRGFGADTSEACRPVRPSPARSGSVGGSQRKGVFQPFAYQPFVKTHQGSFDTRAALNTGRLVCSAKCSGKQDGHPASRHLFVCFLTGG